MTIFSRCIPLFPSLFMCFLCHGVMNFLWNASSQEICSTAATGVHAVHLIFLGPGKDFGPVYVYSLPPTNFYGKKFAEIAEQNWWNRPLLSWNFSKTETENSKNQTAKRNGEIDLYYAKTEQFFGEIFSKRNGSIYIWGWNFDHQVTGNNVFTSSSSDRVLFISTPK